MTEPIFFPANRILTIRIVAELAGCLVPENLDPQTTIADVAPLETAGPDDLAYMDNPAYVEHLEKTRAGFCLVSRRYVGRVPATTYALVTNQPYHAFARAMTLLYPSAIRPSSNFEATGVSPGSFVHPTARLEQHVLVDPGAVIGPYAEIGSGSVIGSHAVIGAHVRIGRDCSIGPNTTILNAFIGNRVILHPGVRIGQDGFGFAMGPKGHLKVPQIGRVIIQDDVEIGANSTIDRGASRDTVIGEGTKIDNLVQIGHNVNIGRHCVIVANVGIAGSTVLEDFVVMGGGVGVAGHITIGAGAQIAAYSGVNNDVPRGARVAGIPAQPFQDWVRQWAMLKRLALRRPGRVMDDAPED